MSLTLALCLVFSLFTWCGLVSTAEAHAPPGSESSIDREPDMRYTQTCYIIPDSVNVAVGQSEYIQTSMGNHQTEHYTFFRWTSSDTSVATVDVYGNVTGVAPGTATINLAFTSVSHMEFDSCTITVFQIINGPEYHGYSGIFSNGNKEGIKASLTLPSFYPYVELSSESAWISTSKDSLGRWIQIGARYKAAYSNFKLYTESWQNGEYTRIEHQNLELNSILDLQIEYSENLSKWVAVYGYQIKAAAPLTIIETIMQAKSEVHKKYIQMGPYHFSNVQTLNNDNVWSFYTRNPTANEMYAYSGTPSDFITYGPVFD